jgi:hypothetical protein
VEVDRSGARLKDGSGGGGGEKRLEGGTDTVEGTAAAGTEAAGGDDDLVACTGSFFPLAFASVHRLHNQLSTTEASSAGDTFAQRLEVMSTQDTTARLQNHRYEHASPART